MGENTSKLKVGADQYLTHGPKELKSSYFQNKWNQREEQLWICDALIHKLWALEDSSKRGGPLDRLCKALRKIEWQKKTKRLDLTPDQNKKWLAFEKECKREQEKSYEDRVNKEFDFRGQDTLPETEKQKRVLKAFKNELDRAKEKWIETHSDRIEAYWVLMPNMIRLTSDSSKATILKPGEADEIKALIAPYVECSETLSEGLREAVKLGLSIDSRLMPHEKKKLSKTWVAIFNGTEVPFSVISTYEERVSYALFFQDPNHPGRSGFFTAQKGISKDIGVARLFSDPKSAKKWMNNHMRLSCALVEVQVSAVRFTPLSERSHFPDLEAVMAVKEKKDIEDSLKFATVSPMEDEVKRREEDGTQKTGRSRL